MNLASLSALLLLLLTLLIPLSFAQRAPDPRRTPSSELAQPSQPRFRKLTLDLLDAPTSLAELTRKSLVIVYGEVTRLLSTYYWPWMDLRPQPGSMIASDLELTVERAIKGRFVKFDKIAVLAYQGTLDGVTQEIEWTPDLRVGEKYFLFLQEMEPRFLTGQLPEYGIPRMSIVGEWVGRFREEGGQVLPVSPDKVPFHRELSRTPVNEFERIVKEAASSPVP